MAHLEISQDRLHLGERFAISFQRTLRIPDDGRIYPLPPGLEQFPIYRVADFADCVPPEWHEHGGVFIAITGIEPPPPPIDAKEYTDSDLSWFALYDESAGDVPVSEHLTQVKTITARDAERGEPTQGEASLDISAAHIRTVRRDDTRATRDQSSSSETTEQA